MLEHPVSGSKYEQMATQAHLSMAMPSATVSRRLTSATKLLLKTMFLDFEMAAPIDFDPMKKEWVTSTFQAAKMLRFHP